MTTMTISSQSKFLEHELMKSFLANPVALQLAAFHKLDFKDGMSVEVTIVTDQESTNAKIQFINADDERKAEHYGVGEPCQYFEWFAHLVNKYAECNNTKVVTYS